MDPTGLPEPIRARMEQLAARPPIDKVRDFLSGYVADAGGLSEIRSDLQRVASFNTATLRADLEALESILSEPQAPGTLLHLVAGHGGWDLDDNPTDAGAGVVLGELAELVRAVVEQAEQGRGAP